MTTGASPRGETPRGATPGRHAAILMGASQIASRERLFLATADLLVERGWRVTLLAPRPVPELVAAAAPPLELIDIAEVAGRSLPSSTPHVTKIYAGVWRLTAFLKQEQPNVLMATSIPPNITALLAGRRSGGKTPIIIRQSNPVPHRNDPDSRHVRKRLRDFLMPSLYPSAAKAIAVSKGVAANLASSGWIAPDRIEAIPNGVALDAVDAKAKEPVDHSWLGEERAQPVIVAVGRLIKKKDYPTLFHALAALPEARLIVLGEGPERGSLQRLAERLNLSDRIDLIGRKSNPFAYLARADLFVLASRFEGMPSVVIEALACGCPVVSTDCPSGPSEILDGGAYGRLVPMAAPRALAAAMAEALEAPRDAAKLKARAGAFSLTRTVERYADVITETAAD